MEETKDISPSQGEDNALQGYGAQYEIIAELILQALNKPDFEYAILKDPRAEKLDDVQIVFTDCVEAYQIKWAKPPKNLTQSDLLASDSSPESGFFKQLANGWVALKDRYQTRKCLAHIYTSMTSGGRISLVSETATGPQTIDEFLSSYWNELEPSDESIEKWKPFLDAIKDRMGLDESLYVQFKQSCKFYLNRRLTDERENFADAVGYKNDVLHLQSRLLVHAGKNRGALKLTRADILELANWGSRFEFRFRHDFPSPTYYVPIKNTIERLESSLQRFSQGYLALVGTPGSGKSTLLTTTLRYKEKYRVFRYYCFVPDDAALSRGEAYNFLHDIVLNLSQGGIQPWKHSMGESVDELRLSFERQLQIIGKDYAEKGIKTIVLIDGLDHIRREGNPRHSLLDELPQSSAIPDGCIFILGTQKIENVGLSSGICAELSSNSSSRTITMGAIPREGIREIVLNRFPEISEECLSAVESRSSGHPLALSYILNQLDGEDSEKLESSLNEIPEYKGDIESSYKIYWDEIDPNPKLKDLLALMSRMRGSIDLSLMRHMSDDETINSLVKSGKHFFLALHNNRWRFFHNSFRQFILDQTGRNAFGYEDEISHRAYHEKLAELSVQSFSPTIFRWEKVFHLFHAGKYRELLKSSTQQYFREHFLETRPIELIKEDIGLVIRAAGIEEDKIAVIRMLLCDTEFSQRSGILDEFEPHSLLLDLGRSEEAVKHVMHEGQLLVSQEHALDFACRMADCGFIDTAKEIFDLAEPLELLAGVQSDYINTNISTGILESWVRAASRFRSFEEVIGVINTLLFSETYTHESAEEATQHYRQALFIELLDECIDTSKDDDFENLPKLFSSCLDEQFVQKRVAYTILSADVDLGRLKNVIDYLVQLSETEKIPNSILLRMAGLLFKDIEDKESAEKLFSTIDSPGRVVDEGGSPNNLSALLYRLRYYRMSAALGQRIEPTKAVLDAEQGYRQAEVLVERMYIRAANLWGLAWKAEVQSPSVVVNELAPAIRLLENSRSRDLSLSFSGLHKPYIEMLLHAAHAHGESALIEFLNYIEAKWDRDSDSGTGIWFSSLRRHVLLTVFRLTGNKAKLIELLESYGSDLSPEEDVRDFLESSQEVASIWIEVGDSQRASDLVEKMVQNSFGLYYEKDSQIKSWAAWFARALRSGVTLTENEFTRFLDGIATTAAYGRGSGETDAAKLVLSALTEINPEAAFKLNELFLQESALDFQDSLSAILVSCFKDSKINFKVPISLFRWISLPYVRYPDSEVLNAIANRLAVIEVSEAKEVLSSLCDAVVSEMSESDCGTWRADILESLKNNRASEELCNIVQSRLSEKKPRDSSTKGSITLQDGMTIEEDALIESSKDIDILISYLKNIKEDRFYSWDLIIEPLLNRVSSDNAIELFHLLVAIGKTGRYLSGLINKLAEFGDTAAAEEYANTAIEKSNHRGWSVYSDGGSRIEPYKILIRLDDKYCSAAFSQFVDDYFQGTGIYHLDSSLDDLVQVFWRDPPIDEIWGEIYEHVSHLREFSNPTVTTPSELQLGMAETVPLVEKLLKIACNCFEWPLPEYRRDSYSALVEIFSSCESHREYLSLYASNLLSLPHEKPLLGAALIKGFETRASINLNQFQDQLKELLVSDDMAFRLVARSLLSSNNSIPSIKKERRLPAAYTLELPAYQAQKVSTSAALNKGEVLHDTQDPLEIVSIALDSLKVLSRITKIPIRNLVERTVSLMSSLESISRWDKKAESELQNWCKKLRLETSYRRPRAYAATKALGYVIAELYDAGLMDDDALQFLAPSLTIHDLLLSLLEPSPNLISPANFSLKDDFLFRTSDWVQEKPQFEISQPPETGRGEIVLGFISKAEVPHHERSKEYLVASICPPHFSVDESGHNPRKIIPGYWLSHWWTASSYPELPNLDMALQDSLLINSSLNVIEIGNPPWLAINPLIPLDLGWKLEEGSLFKWIDEEGNAMVWSEWWRRGRLGRFPHRDGVHGEGWIVKASEHGFEILRNSMYPAKWVCGVSKSQDKSEGEVTNDFIAAFELT